VSKPKHKWTAIRVDPEALKVLLNIKSEAAFNISLGSLANMALRHSENHLRVLLHLPKRTKNHAKK
jgi:hypothetical protein